MPPPRGGWGVDYPLDFSPFMLGFLALPCPFSPFMLGFLAPGLPCSSCLPFPLRPGRSQRLQGVVEAAWSAKRLAG